MRSRYTPGPWKVENEDLFRIVSEFGCIARVEGAAYPDDETMPNARLIAAAPTMLTIIEKHAALGDSECIMLLEAINGSS